MSKKIVRGTLEIILTVIIILGLSALSAYMLSVYKNMRFSDALFWIGATTTIIGIAPFLGFSRGSRELLGNRSTAEDDSKNYYKSYNAGMERQIPIPEDNALNHVLFQVTNQKINTLIGGIMVFIASFFV